MALKHVITRSKPYWSTQSLRNAEKDTQSKQNSWGLTTLAFAQLDQGRPRGPRYLHSVYSIEFVRSIARYINPWRTVSTKIGSSAVYRTCELHKSDVKERKQRHQYNIHQKNNSDMTKKKSWNTASCNEVNPKNSHAKKRKMKAINITMPKYHLHLTADRPIGSFDLLGDLGVN